MDPKTTSKKRLMDQPPPEQHSPIQEVNQSDVSKDTQNQMDVSQIANKNQLKQQIKDQLVSWNIHQFENFALTAGSKYLEVGGPTTRLEDKIVQLGNSYGLEPEVFAMPSAIIVSAMNTKKRFTTSLKRINESSIDLNILFKIDVLFDRVIRKDISIAEALSIVTQEDYSRDLYSKATMSLASFAVGFLASYLHFQSLASGFVSGALSFMLMTVVQPFFRSLKFTRIFFVFFASLLSIGISAMTEAFWGLPIEASFIGSLIVLVPGLMLTTAVSELAEHNFVSGTVKLVNGVLVLISIGTALFIGKDIISFLNPKALPLNFNYNLIDGNSMGLVPSIIGTLLIMLAFCLIFQIPKRLIISAIATGVAGQIGFELFKYASSYALPSFVAAFMIGITSLCFSHLFKIPSQIFSVPGIVSLVPGVLSFTIYNSTSLGAGANASSDSTILTVATIASSIVFGLIMARFPFRLYSKTRGLPFIPTE